MAPDSWAIPATAVRSTRRAVPTIPVLMVIRNALRLELHWSIAQVMANVLFNTNVSLREGGSLSRIFWTHHLKKLQDIIVSLRPRGVAALSMHITTGMQTLRIFRFRTVELFLVLTYIHACIAHIKHTCMRHQIMFAKFNARATLSSS